MASLLELFPKLNLTETSAFSLDKVEEDYVLDIAVQHTTDATGQMLAATSSNHTIRLFSHNNLAGTDTIKGHTSVISGICWGKTESNMLFSCSEDKTVRCWDTRAKLSKEVQKFEGSDETKNIFLCLDVNATDRVICAGQESEDDEGAYILFWDRRAGDLLGAYSDSHEDDITTVCFHPTKADSLVTGSTDGLVCVFDIGEECEDDALAYTFNSCQTVAKVGWCGAENNNVYCTTHMDTLHVWDSIEGDPVVEWTDLKDQLKGKESIEYILDLLPCDGDETYLLAGNNEGDLRIIDLSCEGSPKVTCSLTGGHKAIVRCMHWDNKNCTLVTGAEDSMLCLWSTNQKATPNKPTKVKMKARKSVTKRSNPY